MADCCTSQAYVFAVSYSQHQWNLWSGIRPIPDWHLMIAVAISGSHTNLNDVKMARFNQLRWKLNLSKLGISQSQVYELIKKD